MSKVILRHNSMNATSAFRLRPSKSRPFNPCPVDSRKQMRSRKSVVLSGQAPCFGRGNKTVQFLGGAVQNLQGGAANETIPHTEGTRNNARTLWPSQLTGGSSETTPALETPAVGFVQEPLNRGDGGGQCWVDGGDAAH
eukprot:EG_transcript_10566